MGTRKDFLDREIVQSVRNGWPECGSGTPVAERREFLSACSAALITTATQISLIGTSHAKDATTSKRYSASILADESGRPVRVSALKARINYLFHYPFVSTPCLLVNLGRDVKGAGPGNAIVAFSAICSHKLAYPAREVSFIRFQADASKHSEADRIHCCADHSVYDPAAAAKVVAGPAPMPLASVMLEYDKQTDSLRAVGLSGPDQIDAFFTKYEFKLGIEFGNAAKRLTGSSTRLQELTQFCRNVAQC